MGIRDQEECLRQLSLSSGNSVPEANSRLNVISLGSLLAVSLSASVAVAQVGINAPVNAAINRVQPMPVDNLQQLEEKEKKPEEEDMPLNQVDDSYGDSSYGFFGNAVRGVSHGFVGSIKHMCHKIDSSKSVNGQMVKMIDKSENSTAVGQSSTHLRGCFGWSAKAHSTGSHS